MAHHEQAMESHEREGQVRLRMGYREYTDIRLNNVKLSNKFIRIQL